MKASKLNEVIDNTPVFYPVFSITKVPGWLDNHEAVVGHLVYFDRGHGTFVLMNRAMTIIAFAASHVKFERYYTSDEIRNVIRGC